jgi:hypothetical protein
METSFLSNLYANTHEVLGAFLSIENIAEISVLLLIATVAYYHRKMNLLRSQKRQEATAVQHDVKNAILSLRAELDAMLVIQRKDISLENKEIEYKSSTQKISTILEKLERYGLQDIEKML